MNLSSKITSKSFIITFFIAVLWSPIFAQKKIEINLNLKNAENINISSFAQKAEIFELSIPKGINLFEITNVVEIEDGYLLSHTANEKDIFPSYISKIDRTGNYLKSIRNGKLCYDKKQKHIYLLSEGEFTILDLNLNELERFQLIAPVEDMRLGSFYVFSNRLFLFFHKTKQNSDGIYDVHQSLWSIDFDGKNPIEHYQFIDANRSISRISKFYVNNQALMNVNHNNHMIYKIHDDQKTESLDIAYTKQNLSIAEKNNTQYILNDNFLIGKFRYRSKGYIFVHSIYTNQSFVSTQNNDGSKYISGFYDDFYNTGFHHLGVLNSSNQLYSITYKKDNQLSEKYSQGTIPQLLIAYVKE